MPHTFGCPHMFGFPLVCLDAPCMFRCHNMFGCTLCMFECPFIFGCPICLNVPLYVSMPSICLAAPCMSGCCQMYGVIQRYEGHPNIWGVSKHTGKHPNIWGCPNIQGAFLHAFLSCKAGFATRYIHIMKHV